MLVRGICLFIALALSSPIQAETPPSAGSSAEGPLVDPAWCLRIDPGATGGQPLDEPTISPMVSDAIAGAIGPAGSECLAAILVEREPDASLLELARARIAAMPLDHPRLVALEPTEYCGRDAVRFEILGDVDGDRFRYVDTIFVNDGHAFQVIAFGPVEADRSILEDFTRCVTLLDGPVRGRGRAARPTAVLGEGWRIRDDGTYESATSRIRIRPGASWRIAVGRERVLLAPDADVALVHTEADAYVSLRVQRAGGLDRDAFIRYLHGDGMRRLGRTSSAESTTMRVDGRDRAADRFQLEGSPVIEARLATFFEGARCYQVLACVGDADREEVEPDLRAILDSVEILDTVKADRLAEEILAAGSPKGVESVHSCEDGTIVWQRSHGFWRVRIGDAARHIDPNVSMVLEERGLGIFGLMSSVSTGRTDARAHHEATVEEYLGLSRSKLVHRPLRLGGMSAYSTEGLVHDGLPMRYRVVTAFSEGRVLQALFFGFPGNMEAARGSLDEAIAGLRLEVAPMGARVTR